MWEKSNSEQGCKYHTQLNRDDPPALRMSGISHGEVGRECHKQRQKSGRIGYVQGALN